MNDILRTDAEDTESDAEAKAVKVDLIEVLNDCLGGRQLGDRRLWFQLERESSVQKEFVIFGQFNAWVLSDQGPIVDEDIRCSFEPRFIISSGEEYIGTIDESGELCLDPKWCEENCQKDPEAVVRKGADV